MGAIEVLSSSFPHFKWVCSAIRLVPGSYAQGVDTPQITVLLPRCGCYPKGVEFTVEGLSFVAYFLLNQQGFLSDDTALLIFKGTSFTKTDVVAVNLPHLHSLQ